MVRSLGTAPGGADRGPAEAVLPMVRETPKSRPARHRARPPDPRLAITTSAFATGGHRHPLSMDWPQPIRTRVGGHVPAIAATPRPFERPWIAIESNLRIQSAEARVAASPSMTTAQVAQALAPAGFRMTAPAAEFTGLIARLAPPRPLWTRPASRGCPRLSPNCARDWPQPVLRCELFPARGLRPDRAFCQAVAPSCSIA